MTEELTPEGLDQITLKLSEEYPLLDFSFPDGYTEELQLIIKEAQLAKVQKARSPDREKIDSITVWICSTLGLKLGVLMEQFPQDIIDGAYDQIIALIETDAISYTKGVLDGRKQERERIGVMLSVSENELGFVEISNHVPYQDLQALKGEK